MKIPKKYSEAVMRDKTMAKVFRSRNDRQDNGQKYSEAVMTDKTMAKIDNKRVTRSRNWRNDIQYNAQNR